MARSRVPADPKAPNSQVRITDFGGMSPGTDQHDNDPGLSWYQVNVVPFHPGELRARKGFSVVRFEADPEDHDETVALPLVRYADASTAIGLVPSAWNGRDLRPSAYSSFSATPSSSAERVMCLSTAVLTPAAEGHVDGAQPAPAGSSFSVSASADSENVAGGDVVRRVDASSSIAVSPSASGSVPGGDEDGFTLLELI